MLFFSFSSILMWSNFEQERIGLSFWEKGSEILKGEKGSVIHLKRFDHSIVALDPPELMWSWTKVALALDLGTPLLVILRLGACGSSLVGHGL